jgi:hypothetical protein
MRRQRFSGRDGSHARKREMIIADGPRRRQMDRLSEGDTRRGGVDTHFGPLASRADRPHPRGRRDCRASVSESANTLAGDFACGRFPHNYNRKLWPICIARGAIVAVESRIPPFGG